MRVSRHLGPITAAPTILLVLLLPVPAAANPIMMPDPRFLSRLVVFGLLWVLVLLIEGAVLKLALFGLEGASWPRAFLTALGVNIASGVAGGLAGVQFDFWAFEFLPSPWAVLGISLGVEGGILLAVFARWRPLRALITGVAMNAASYLLLILTRLPGGAQL